MSKKRSSYSKKLTRRRRRRLVAAGAIPVVVVAVTLGLTLHSGGGKKAAAAPAPSAPTSTATPSTPGLVWQNHVIGVDFKSLTGVVLGLDQSLVAWSSKKATSASALTAANHALPDIIASREALAAEKPFPQAPQALEDYRSSVELYVEGVKLDQSAAALPSGALQTQVENASLRLRDIGDSLVDQAADIMAPYLPNSQNASLTFVPAPEVPDWASLSLAPGEPLDVTPAKVAPQRYDANRRTQPVAGWLAAVKGLKIPTGAAEAAAITGGSTGTDQAMSREFAAAVTTLTATPDPLAGGAHAAVTARADSVRERLALLVDAEATRAAQAAALAPAAERADLKTAAQTIALIGDGLWDQRAGARTTGFPAALLTAGTSEQSGPTSSH